MASQRTFDTAFVGGGVIGLMSAWRLARAGASVAVFEAEEAFGRGASWAAAGMLAPAYECAAEPGAHPRLGELAMESRRLWEETASAAGVGFLARQTLAAAETLEQLQAIDAAAAASEDWSGDADSQSGPPIGLLGPNVTAAAWLKSDAAIDPRELIGALLERCREQGVALVKAAPVKSLEPDPKIGWALHGLGALLGGARQVVLTAGHRTAALSGLSPALGAIAPVKGQMVRLTHPGGFRLPCVVRMGPLYLVPREDGSVVVGATVEPGRSDCDVEPSAAEALARRAAELVPGLQDAVISESWAGVRPATPDLAPMIGPLGGQPGLWCAAGHYRNGVLLAPVTAELLAAGLQGERLKDLWSAFTPARFAAAGRGQEGRLPVQGTDD